MPAFETAPDGPAASIDERRHDRRTVPRYPVDTEIFASLDGHTVRLRNISRHGVAICASGLDSGGIHLLELHLDRHHLALTVEIVDCSDQGLLHARFLRPDASARQRIDAYITALLPPVAGTSRVLR